MEAVLSPLGVTLARAGAMPGREEASLLDAGEDVTDFAPAVAELGRRLAARGARRGRLRVRLSGHFVRFAVIPAVDGLNTEEERLAHAQHCFAGAYGALAGGLELTVASARAGEARLAAGIRSPLLLALRELATGAGLRLAQVEPLFAGACNTFRRGLSGTTFWLGVLEPGRVCLGLNRAGAWQAVRNQHFLGADSRALLDLLEGSALAEGVGAEHCPVYLVGADAEEARYLGQAGWPATVLAEGRGWQGLRQEPQAA